MRTTIRRARRGRLPASIAWLALALPLSAAAADLVEIEWGAAGRFERTLAAPAGKFVEVCGKLAKGVRVRWEFGADRPLDFNVHYHLGKEVVYPAKQDAVASASGELLVPVDQDYCWMWTNKSGGEAKLQLRLAR